VHGYEEEQERDCVGCTVIQWTDFTKVSTISKIPYGFTVTASLVPIFTALTDAQYQCV